MFKRNTNEENPVRIPGLYCIKSHICTLNSDVCCTECCYSMQALDFRCPAEVLSRYLLFVLKSETVLVEIQKRQPLGRWQGGRGEEFCCCWAGESSPVFTGVPRSSFRSGVCVCLCAHLDSSVGSPCCQDTAQWPVWSRNSELELLVAAMTDSGAAAGDCLVPSCHTGVILSSEAIHNTFAFFLE